MNRCWKFADISENTHCIIKYVFKALNIEHKIKNCSSFDREKSMKFSNIPFALEIYKIHS